MFLSDFQAVEAQERAEMVQKLESDTAYGRKVGEHIIELLDRIESHIKPRMVALVFKAYSESHVDSSMLHRLNSAIEKIPLFEVRNIRQFSDVTPEERFKISPTSLQAFLNSGLADISSGLGKLVYKPNDVCANFLAFDLDRVQS